MFSSRLDWSQQPNALGRALLQKRRESANILDLTESNPTRAGFSYPDVLSPLTAPQAAGYEPDPLGLPGAREAVSQYYGGAADPSRIILTASTSEAYSYLFHLLADTGDEILTPRPSYPLFEYLARLASVRLRQYPLRYDGTWHIDFEELERAAGPRTRAVVVVNPNNPTGSFLKAPELEKLDAFAARHGMAIISDEVFADYGFASDPGRIETLIGDRAALTFSMSGLSKVAGLPQMKLGWIVASGPGAGRALAALELIADTYLSVAMPVQVALPELLKSGIQVRDAIRDRIARNRISVADAFSGSAATVLRVEGGWYSPLQVPRIRTEEQWSLALLEQADVLVQPGFFFDFESEAFLIVSLLTPEAVLAEGLRGIRQFL